MINQKIITLFLCTILLFACRKETPFSDGSTQEGMNRWMFEQMQYYYLWNNQLPAHPVFDQDPNAFFNSIKYKEDRFSALYYKKAPSGFTGTLINNFGVDIEGIADATVFKAFILLVVPGSDAATQGLKRGMTVKQVNGVLLTAGNINRILDEALAGKSISLTLADEKTVTIPGAYIAEPVIYNRTIFNTSNGNAGYLFLNSFEYNGAYEILEALQYFKAQKVTDLIIDLRYNPGGSVPFAAFLTALVAPVTQDQVYVIYKGNQHAGTLSSSFKNEIRKQPDGYDFDMATLVANRLPLSRIFLLTGSHTTSAAELFINNLKPYLRTIQIGEPTFGKDLASIEIQDERTPPVITDIILYPICFKLYNANGSGDYFNGIHPDYPLSESAVLPLLPIGDRNDPLISLALSQIESKQTGTLFRSLPNIRNPQIIYHSRDAKSRQARLLYTAPPQPHR